ncbi:YabP/YqfC family sporulation protein [Caldicellulosiruptoraceae bacterium PP1]
MDDKKNINKKVHSLILENRYKLTVNGIDDVESFDENNIVLIVDQDILIIKGSNLKINKINTDTGDAFIEGDIYSLEYGQFQKKGLFSRFFR